MDPKLGPPDNNKCLDHLARAGAERAVERDEIKCPFRADHTVKRTHLEEHLRSCPYRWPTSTPNISQKGQSPAPNRRLTYPSYLKKLEEYFKNFAEKHEIYVKTQHQQKLMHFNTEAKKIKQMGGKGLAKLDESDNPTETNILKEIKANQQANCRCQMPSRLSEVLRTPFGSESNSSDSDFEGFFDDLFSSLLRKKSALLSLKKPSNPNCFCCGLSKNFMDHFEADVRNLCANEKFNWDKFLDILFDATEEIANFSETNVPNRTAEQYQAIKNVFKFILIKFHKDFFKDEALETNECHLDDIEPPNHRWHHSTGLTNINEQIEKRLQGTSRQKKETVIFPSLAQYFKNMNLLDDVRFCHQSSQTLIEDSRATNEKFISERATQTELAEEPLGYLKPSFCYCNTWSDNPYTQSETNSDEMPDKDFNLRQYEQMIQDYLTCNLKNDPRYQLPEINEYDYRKDMVELKQLKFLQEQKRALENRPASTSSFSKDSSNETPRAAEHPKPCSRNQDAFRYSYESSAFSNAGQSRSRSRGPLTAIQEEPLRPLIHPQPSDFHTASLSGSLQTQVPQMQHQYSCFYKVQPRRIRGDKRKQRKNQRQLRNTPRSAGETPEPSAASRSPQIRERIYFRNPQTVFGMSCQPSYSKPPKIYITRPRGAKGRPPGFNFDSFSDESSLYPQVYACFHTRRKAFRNIIKPRGHPTRPLPLGKQKTAENPPMSREIIKGCTPLSLKSEEYLSAPIPGDKLKSILENLIANNRKLLQENTQSARILDSLYQRLCSATTQTEPTETGLTNLAHLIDSTAAEQLNQQKDQSQPSPQNSIAEYVEKLKQDKALGQPQESPKTNSLSSIIKQEPPSPPKLSAEELMQPIIETPRSMEQLSDYSEERHKIQQFIKKQLSLPSHLSKKLKQNFDLDEEAEVDVTVIAQNQTEEKICWKRLIELQKCTSEAKCCDDKPVRDSHSSIALKWQDLVRDNDLKTRIRKKLKTKLPYAVMSPGSKASAPHIHSSASESKAPLKKTPKKKKKCFSLLGNLRKKPIKTNYSSPSSSSSSSSGSATTTAIQPQQNDEQKVMEEKASIQTLDSSKPDWECPVASRDVRHNARLKYSLSSFHIVSSLPGKPEPSTLNDYFSSYVDFEKIDKIFKPAPSKQVNVLYFRNA